MNSILSLIIKPQYDLLPGFKPGMFLYHNNHPYIKDYIRKNEINVNLDAVAIAPLVAEITLRHSGKVRAGNLFQNSSPLLTDVILNHKELEDNYGSLCLNSNPKLADLIISFKDRFTNEHWYYISMNPNEGLTEFIKEHVEIVKKYKLDCNTNPKLTDLIKVHYARQLSGELILPDDEHLINNPNPLFAPVIIKLHMIKPDKFIFGNRNPGLTDYILNHPNIDFNQIALNFNPKLFKFVFDNRHKIDSHMYEFGHNRHIFKLKKLSFEKKTNCILL